MYQGDARATVLGELRRASGLSASVRAGGLEEAEQGATTMALIRGVAMEADN